MIVESKKSPKKLKNGFHVICPFSIFVSNHQHANYYFLGKNFSENSSYNF